MNVVLWSFYCATIAVNSQHTFFQSTSGTMPQLSLWPQCCSLVSETCLRLLGRLPREILLYFYSTWTAVPGSNCTIFYQMHVRLLLFGHVTKPDQLRTTVHLLHRQHRRAWIRSCGWFLSFHITNKPTIFDYLVHTKPTTVSVESSRMSSTRRGRESNVETRRCLKGAELK